MKLHQQGNEIIVTELRPMSDCPTDDLLIYWGLVQMVEQRVLIPCVAGSSPAHPAR